MDPHPRPAAALDARVLAALAATWLIWGSTYLAIRVALVALPPLVQMGSRFVVAGALLMAWTRWRGAPWPNRREWGHATLVGALMIGGGMGGTAVAETSVASGLVVALIAVIPVLMACANALFRIYPTRREACGIALGLLGVVLLARGAGLRTHPAGVAAVGVACLTWTVGSLMTRRGFVLAPGAAGYASEMLCGGLLLLALAAPRDEYRALAAAWPPAAPALGAWFYLVIAGSLIGFNAYMYLLENTSAGLASSYCFVNPLIAMLLGVGLGGETIAPAEWLAAAVVLGGVALLLAGRRPAMG